MRRQYAHNAALAMTLAIMAGAAGPAVAQTAPAAFSAVEFDEIDHVYTTDAVPPPGSFRKDAGLVDSAPVAPKKPSPIFGALSRASSVLSGASSVVSASGEIGRALRIADDVAKVEPLTTAMGMAGSRRFDALLQTYMLPRVSPTGAVMLQGFLAAQTEYKAQFGPTRPDAAPAAVPEQLAPYAKGVLRHYTIGSNGWVRIDDPTTRMTVIIKPDAGKAYLIDNGSSTVRTSDYARSARATAGSAGAKGTVAVSDRTDALGQATLDGVQAAGFRTQSTMRVAGAVGTCVETTITSTRVEYFAPFRIASDAANTSPAAQRPDSGGCEPAGTVKHAGSNVPSDELLVYQANTVEKKTSAGSDRYTVVIERGNVQERSASDLSAFDIPAGMKQVSAADR